MIIPARVQLSFCIPVHTQSYCGIVVLAGSYLKQRPESPELHVIDAPSLVDLRALAMAIEEKRTTIATETKMKNFFILIFLIYKMSLTYSIQAFRLRLKSGSYLCQQR